MVCWCVFVPCYKDLKAVMAARTLWCSSSNVLACCSEIFNSFIKLRENIKSDRNTLVVKVVDILNKTTISPENRRINHFYEHNNVIYIGTNYGISVYNLQALEFGDTFYIGTNGSQVQVKQTVVFNNDLYAATNAGLKTADLNNPNLIDFQFWGTLATGNFTAINSIENNLYAVKSDNNLYKIMGSNLELSLNFSEIVVDLKSNDDFLLVVTNDNVYR